MPTGWRDWAGKYGVGLALAVIVVIAALSVPGFFTRGNITTVLLHVSVNAVLALGMTFVIVTAGIDLSVGSVLGLAGVLVAGTITSAGVLSTFGVVGATVLAVLVGIGTGAAIGLANGAVIAYLRVAPFMVTLAAMTMARGAARLFTGGVPIGFPARGDPHFDLKVEGLDALHLIGGGRIPVPGLPRGFPVPALVMILLVVVGVFVLSRTRFGRHVYAVGGNEEAARLSGVPTRRIKLGVYVISGACAGIASVLMVGQLRSGGPDAGLLYELNAIAAAVIGGASLFGGLGTAWGALIGALLIGVLNNSLDLLGVQSFWQEISKGAIILLAVLFDVWTKRNGTGNA
ncbi:MAG: ABC transporter permease [Gemmatimonadota bacterium]|nr:MAG: ABC transporter permease [Gemmatimonadota bacterium]